MRISVLLADPDETLLDAYRDFLARAGFQVETTTTGSACLDLLREWKPDVLVLEPDMPNGWGERVLDQLNVEPQLAHVSTLILTRGECKVESYPVREYHQKPYSMTELAASIRAAAKGHLRSTTS